jgi:hypothetical protein
MVRAWDSPARAARIGPDPAKLKRQLDEAEGKLPVDVDVDDDAARERLSSTPARMETDPAYAWLCVKYGFPPE